MIFPRPLLLAATLAVAAMPLAAADAWTELKRPGAVVLFRHASAPGVGDPAGFQRGDCATQRNLDEEGRAQARQIGELFRRQQIRVDAVLSSEWCRTRETARLAFGALVRDEPAFNSFFGESAAARGAQTAQARGLITRWQGPGVLVVVTHQVNITALTGVGAASGEGVVVRTDGEGNLKVVASLRP